jgi:hypothetical protein
MLQMHGGLLLLFISHWMTRLHVIRRQNLKSITVLLDVRE